MVKAMIVSKNFSSMLHCNKLELLSSFFHLLKLSKIFFLLHMLEHNFCSKPLISTLSIVKKIRTKLVTWHCDLWWQLVSWRQLRREATETTWRRRMMITWWRTSLSLPKGYSSYLARVSEGRFSRFPPRIPSSCRNRNSSLHNSSLQRYTNVWN